MTKKYIDLQMHSVYSDGILSPQELIQRAKRENLSIIALTDHNCIDGIKEAIAAGKKEKIKVIPGIELYVKFLGKRLNLLGYGIDLENKKLNKILRNLQSDRLDWVRKVLKKAAKTGFQVKPEQIFKTRSKYIGLGHIIYILGQDFKNKALIRKLTRETDPDIFKIIEKFFMKGAPAYVPEKDIPALEALKLISSSGGISVLAHPGQQLRFGDDSLVRQSLYLAFL